MNGSLSPSSSNSPPPSVVGLLEVTLRSAGQIAFEAEQVVGTIAELRR
jgi:hypothetical protein